MKKYLLIAVGFACLVLAYGLAKPNPVLWNSLEVTVTAYNSTPGQTSGDPFLAAWGDRLKPGMDSVAVSRDLIPMGLDHETEVYFTGLDGAHKGPYTVLDKMNRRFDKRIDIYMGVDVQAALEFGEKTATVFWR